MDLTLSVRILSPSCPLILPETASVFHSLGPAFCLVSKGRRSVGTIRTVESDSIGTQNLHLDYTRAKANEFLIRRHGFYQAIVWAHGICLMRAHIP